MSRLGSVNHQHTQFMSIAPQNENGTDVKFLPSQPC